MSAFLDHPAVSRFDDSVDRSFAPLRKNRIVNRIFYAASEAANHSILWHVCAWTFVLLGRRDRRDAAKISAALGIESALVNGPIKMLFKRDRPTESEVRPHGLRTPLTSSFPSGHATSGFCAALLLSHRQRGSLLVYLALAVVVASSRVHVRIHHASDVVAGAALGATFGAITRRLIFRDK